MKEIFNKIRNKPKLFEQSELNMWEDSHISKRMLEAHLDERYDGATRNHRFVKESVSWITKMVPPTQYSNLLDLGCGPGIYAELFSERGYCVTGIDISSRSIQYAMKSKEEKKLCITYFIGDYTTNCFPHKYDVITLIYCDFGVLPGNIRQTLLKNIYNTLTENGVLIFDVFTPTKYNGVEEMKSWELVENGFWHEKSCLTLHAFYRYDEDHTFLNQYVNITSDGVVSNYHVWEHTFTIKELQDDLEQIGFHNITFYGDVSGNECHASDLTIAVLARK